jgi:acetyl esterase/lipase
MAAATATPTLTEGVDVQHQSIGGVACVVCQPAVPTSTILYFHGGGYRVGAATGWIAFGSRLAAAANTRVVIADYRLAPEHPFPNALHDAAAVF